MKRINMRKGQLFSSDIAIATMVFLTALALAFFMWNSVNEDIARSENLRNMQNLLSETIEQLIRTPGLPEDWNVYTVKVPGLATEDRVINQTKILAFVELMNSSNYDSNKYKMGLGSYDFYLNITDLQDNVVTIGNTSLITGKETVGALEMVGTQRTAVFNETIIRINFILWR